VPQSADAVITIQTAWSSQGHASARSREYIVLQTAEYGKVRKRHIAAAVGGNALEFYDFTTYAFYAAQIGHAFFPSQTPLGSLMLSLATFGAGFVTRPLGAIVIGIYADRAGRRPAMLLSFSLMGVALLGLALCPSYAAIGPLAPVLVVAARLLQGFALGGEVGPTTAFLLEAAPLNRRGLYTAFQSISQNVAALVAGVIGLIITSSLDAEQIQTFGWRIAMLIGVLILPFGLLVRHSLPETQHAPDPVYEQPDAYQRLTGGQTRVILCSIAILCGGTVATYVQSYLTTYTSVILHMKINVAFGATVTYGFVGIASNIAGALLSERYGRRLVMIAPRVVLFAVILPAFWLLARNRDATTMTLMTAVLTLCASTSGGAMMGAISESLSKTSRAAIFSVVYAGPIVLFGGTTQLLVTWLIQATGNVLAPAFFYMAATAIALAGMVAMRESAPARLALRTGANPVDLAL
jgi:MHS family citrate/tricarballylate:H+ symporter-like MFS transporter